MRSLALVKSRFLCCYADELDALNLCCALDRYGIAVERRENVTTYSNCSHGPVTYTSHSVWLSNEADYPRAVEFKRGLLAALAIKGDPSAFADGVFAGALMKNRPIMRMMFPSELN